MNNLFIGKLDKKEFFVKYIATIIVGIVFIFLLIKLMNFPLIINYYRFSYEMPLAIIIALVAQIYTISLFIRRLRDAKLSPWITLVTIIKPLDFILFIVLLFVQSKDK